MHLVFDIFQGIGIAAAVGVRPFLPALVTGALAAGDVEIDFHHTKFHFLQQPVFLLVMVVALVLLALRRAPHDRPQGQAGRAPARRSCSALCALALGALLLRRRVRRYHHGHHHCCGSGSSSASSARRSGSPPPGRCWPGSAPGSTTRRAACCRSSPRASPRLPARAVGRRAAGRRDRRARRCCGC